MKGFSHHESVAIHEELKELRESLRVRKVSATTPTRNSTTQHPRPVSPPPVSTPTVGQMAARILYGTQPTVAAPKPATGTIGQRAAVLLEEWRSGGVS